MYPSLLLPGTVRGTQMRKLCKQKACVLVKIKNDEKKKKLACFSGKVGQKRLNANVQGG